MEPGWQCQCRDHLRSRFVTYLSLSPPAGATEPAGVGPRGSAPRPREPAAQAHPGLSGN